MNSKLNLIMNILIIILIIALIVVMMNYYAGTPIEDKIPTDIDVLQEEIIKNSNETIITNIINKEETSGDKIINVNSSGEIEIPSGEKSGDTSIKETNKNETKKENPTVIMTSENEISSKEKKEILTELDKTLMELLDVVDKVQTVDESKLIIDDSEVQE